MTARTDTPKVRIGPTLTALLSGLLVGMLATSIISTALPRILEDLGGNQATLTWMVTATLLAITVSTPIWGKLSDIFSRKTLVLIAIVLFVGASLVAGFAPEPVTLIVSRGIQGVGAGGLLALVQIVMADIISPRDRGKYMGLFGAVMIVGTVGGPIIGGVVTDSVGWRWNFFGSAGIAVIAGILIALTLRPNTGGQSQRIDYAGAILTTLGVSGLLVWITSIDSLFPAVSPVSGILLGGTLVVILLTLVVESKVKAPILPLHLFRNRSFVLTVIASLSVGVATYGVAVFISQYLQMSKAASPTQAGIIALPQVVAVTIASTVIGALISRTGRWKMWMAIGSASQAVGLILLGTITTNTPIPLLWVYLALVGWGIGSVMQNLVLMAENNVDPREIGVASAGVTFYRTLGGTVGVAALGSVIAVRSQAVFSEAVEKLRNAGVPVPSGDLTAVSALSKLPTEVEAAVQDAFARGIGDAYLIAAVLAVITLVCILLLPNKPLSDKTRDERIADLETETSLAAAGAESDRFRQERGTDVSDRRRRERAGDRVSALPVGRA